MILHYFIWVYTNFTEILFASRRLMHFLYSEFVFDKERERDNEREREREREREGEKQWLGVMLQVSFTFLYLWLKLANYLQFYTADLDLIISTQLNICEF